MRCGRRGLHLPIVPWLVSPAKDSFALHLTRHAPWSRMWFPAPARTMPFLFTVWLSWSLTLRPRRGRRHQSSSTGLRIEQLRIGCRDRFRKSQVQVRSSVRQETRIQVDDSLTTVHRGTGKLMEVWRSRIAFVYAGLYTSMNVREPLKLPSYGPYIEQCMLRVGKYYKEGGAVPGGSRSRRRSWFSLGYMLGIALVVLVIVLLILAIID